MRGKMTAVIVCAVAISGATACASKRFVRAEVGRVDGKIDSRTETLSRSLEETQERTRQNETKIRDVEGQTRAARAEATEAQRSATAADQKAGAAGDAARAAADRADAVDRASKRLTYTVVLSEDQGGFRFNETTLPVEARTRIDELVKTIKADPKGAYFEIEGHTDDVGTKDVNDRIGRERAETVKRYLYEQHQIPLHRMNVISYGEKKPLAPNTTKDGRAKNRRIVIKVLI